MGPDEVLRAMLMYFIMPLWLVAGFADYLCHRVAHIEKSSGWTESVLHLVQLGEMAIPVLAARTIALGPAERSTPSWFAFPAGTL